MRRTGPETISISALADAATPGIDTLLGSRQARWHGHVQGPRRRYPEPPRWPVAAGRIVAGSKANGLPPGPALHAELRALAAAGLPGNRVLLAAGHEAALMFGVDNQVGRITPGALADLVLVAGDPLGNAADALSIVAVIRNGRFFSLVSLLERSSAAATVE